MIKQLRKVGNSNALLLDRTLMDLVGLQEKSDVQVTVSDGSLIITPVNPRCIPQEQFEKSLNQVLSEWHDTLRKLA